MGLRRSLRKWLGVEKVEYVETYSEPSGWLSDNVFCQSPSTPLSDVIQRFDPGFSDPDPVNLTHIVNLYSPNSELDGVQRTTLDSMLTARSNPLAGKGTTKLVQVPLRGDTQLVQDQNCVFTTPPLKRTVLDCGDFKIPRPLPLLFDILEQGASAAGPEDYLIYTNSDICLQPIFYGVVRQLIAAGFDAITINRRTFGDERLGPLDPLTMAEVGQAHKGYDCFVFSRQVFDSFVRAESCLGIAGVARPLLFNLVAHSNRMLMLKNVNLTFHFGDDQPWRDVRFDDYNQRNSHEVEKCLKNLAEKRMPRLRLLDFCRNHREYWQP